MKVAYTQEQIQQSKRDEAIRRIADLRNKAERAIADLENAMIKAAELGCAEGRIKAASASTLFTISY